MRFGCERSLNSFITHQNVAVIVAATQLEGFHTRRIGGRIKIAQAFPQMSAFLRILGPDSNLLTVVLQVYLADERRDAATVRQR
jgi:hypothetical protein